MTNHPLKQYVNDAKSAGLSNDQILEELNKSGWKINDIIDFIAEAKPEVKKEESIIKVNNLSKHYGAVKALENVSLEISAGQVTALLGPNGAGKTTLIRVLTTLLKPTSGNVSVANLDVIKDSQKLRSIIGLTGQYAAVDEVLTGRENVEMIGRLCHLSIKEVQTRTDELLRKFDLEDAADRAVRTYSGGMRRRLDLAASLIAKPKILFLDEPTTGLDPRSRFVLWNVIRDLVAAGTTVLLTTQYLEEADQLADYIFVIDHGQIIASGTSNELKRQIGGSVLEVHMANHNDASRAAEVLKQFGHSEPHQDLDMGIITMPVEGEVGILAEVIRIFDDAKLKIQDIRLRQPSLDDVFMKLTGHEAK